MFSLYLSGRVSQCAIDLPVHNNPALICNIQANQNFLQVVSCFMCYYSELTETAQSKDYCH